MRFIVLVALLGTAVACGPTTPPTQLEAPVANASAPAPPADPGIRDAGEDAISVPVTMMPASATPPPKTDYSALPAPPDECTPIGVELEKKARPKLRECYRDGKKKDAELKGAVKLTIDVDTLGKAKDPRAVDNTLPKPVADCMLKVIKDAKLAPAEAGKCAGKSITIPIAFPTPQ